MKLSEIKQALTEMNEVKFILPSGTTVPAHFHVTEVGAVVRHFIDCGGTERLEKKVNFQLWVAGDEEHRLQAVKLIKIIDLAQQTLGLGDWEVEVEYQGDTIGKYGLNLSADGFELTTTSTACLAQDACGIPDEKRKVSLATLGTADSSNCCTPGGGCC